MPLVVRMPQGAGHQLGPTHSHSFEALYLHVPACSSPRPRRRPTPRACSRPRSATTTRSIFIEHEYLYGQRGEVPDDADQLVAFGKAAIAARATT